MVRDPFAYNCMMYVLLAYWDVEFVSVLLAYWEKRERGLCSLGP